MTDPQSQSQNLGPSQPLPTYQTCGNNGTQPSNSGTSSPRSTQSSLNSSSALIDNNKAKSAKDDKAKHGIIARLGSLCTRRNLIILAIPIIMLVILLSVLLTVLPHGSARPNPPPIPANGAEVHLSYGRYKGVDASNGVSFWLGMRYAAPPTGSLRWAAPQPPELFDGVQDANVPMKGCVGVGPTTRNSEDCLGMDVYAPTDANTTSKLPVFLFIQGGGLNAATGHPNASGLIIASDMNMVVASISYRTGIFGFLASEEIANSSSAALNVGLLDQRRAMEWVKEHISFFGGDPDHVVIGGQSAGAGTIVSHLTAHGGKDEGLYKAAIMESQSMPSIRTVQSSQFQFDNLAKRVGCDNDKDKLACLRSKPHDSLMKNALSQPFPDGAGGKPVFAYNTVIDGELIRDIPIKAFMEGKFIRVPVILGDVTNEGDIFVRKTANTVEKARNFLKDTFPRFNETSLDRISELYEFEGSSGREMLDKVATAYGDVRYTCPGSRIATLVAQKGQQDVWNFRYNVKTVSDKVTHGADLSALWSNRYSNAGRQARYADVVPSFQGYWTSFIETLNPNTHKDDTSPEWSRWNVTDGERMRFDLGIREMEPLDAQQKERCDYLATIDTWLEQ